MNRLDLKAQEIGQLKTHLQETNRATQALKRRQLSLSQVPVVSRAGNLADNLKQILPLQLMPGNVGHINNVSWDFYYTFEFDFTDDVVITNLLREVDSIQVSQEAGFVVTGIERHANTYGVGGDLGPWQVELRDRQSSRFFNNRPIPIQMIGQKGYITPLPTGMLVMPNAFLDLEMSSWLDAGISQPTLGSNKHTFTLYGWRVRIEDAEKVLSSVFG